MPLWCALFVLIGAWGSRLQDEDDDLDLEGGCDPKTLQQLQLREKTKFDQSPWREESWRTQAGFSIEWRDILGELCTGKTGIPSIVEFVKTENHTGAADMEGNPAGAAHAEHRAVPQLAQGGLHAPNFKAVFKMSSWKWERYDAEAELTQIVGEASGLVLNLIQGGHTFQAGERTGQTYLLTELMDSVDMFFLVNMKKFPNRDQYLFGMISAQLVHILMALEISQVIHADFKFENFLLTPMACREAFTAASSGAKGRKIWIDNGCRIVLIDFGLACTDDEALVASRRRPMGCLSLRGSPGWASPEVLQDGFPSAFSDVFAAGIFLYMFFTGSFPQFAWFPRDVPEEAVDRLLLQVTKVQDLRQAIGSSGTHVPPAIRKLPSAIKQQLELMLHPQPEHRPSPATLWEAQWLGFQQAHAPEIRGATVHHYRNAAVNADRSALEAWTRFKKDHRLGELPRASPDAEDQIGKAFDAQKDEYLQKMKMNPVRRSPQAVQKARAHFQAALAPQEVQEALAPQEVQEVQIDGEDELLCPGCDLFGLSSASKPSAPTAKSGAPKMSGI